MKPDLNQSRFKSVGKSVRALTCIGLGDAADDIWAVTIAIAKSEKAAQRIADNLNAVLNGMAHDKPA